MFKKLPNAYITICVFIIKISSYEQYSSRVFRMEFSRVFLERIRQCIFSSQRTQISLSHFCWFVLFLYFIKKHSQLVSKKIQAIFGPYIIVCQSVLYMIGIPVDCNTQYKIEGKFTQRINWPVVLSCEEDQMEYVFQTSCCSLNARCCVGQCQQIPHYWKQIEIKS